MLPLGTLAPKFELTNTINGKIVKSSDYYGKPFLVMFICNHCPYVIHIRDSFKKFTLEYMKKGVTVVAINANSTETHPQDGPLEMRQLGLDYGWRFPYLFDETQEVAKAYKAACTPDFFLFDEDHLLVYRGQYDDSRPKNNIQVTGKDLREALDALLEGRSITQDQKPSMGCNIKWNYGNEPEYFIVN
jgi:peroxiredoxin